MPREHRKAKNLKSTAGKRSKRHLRSSPAQIERIEPRILLAAYTVNIAGDNGQASVGLGSGTSGDLRYCLNKAILDQQADTITFASSLAGQTIQLAAISGLFPQITPANNPAAVYGTSSFFVGPGDKITLDGSNAPGVTVNGNGKGRLFTVFGGSLSLVNLQLTGGQATGGDGAHGGGGGGAGAGGAVFVDGANFTARGVTFSNNKAIGGNGGAGGYNGGSIFGGGGGGGGLGVAGRDHNGDNGGNGGGQNGGLGVLPGRIPGNKNLYAHDVLGHTAHSVTVNAGGFGGGGGGGGRSSSRVISYGRNSYTAANLFKVQFGDGDNKNLASGVVLKVGGSGGNGGFGGGGGGVGAGINVFNIETFKGVQLKHVEAAGIGGYGGGGGGLNHITGVFHGGIRVSHTARNSGFGGGAGAGLISSASGISNSEGGGGGGGAGFGGAVFSNGGTLTLDRDTFAGNSALGGFGGTSAGPNAAAGLGGMGLGGAVFAVNGTVDVRRSVAAGDEALSTSPTGSGYSGPQPGADFYFDARKTSGVKGDGTINAAVNFTSDAGMLSLAGQPYTTLQSVPFQLESPTQLTYNGQPQPAMVYVGNSQLFISALDGVAPTLTYAQVNGNGILTNLGTAAPAAVGNYDVIATFPDTAHYLAGQATFTFSINKVAPQLTVSDTGGVADFSKTFPATATVTGANGVSGSSLEGVMPSIAYSIPGVGFYGYTAPNAPGTYQAVATFPGSADYGPVTASTTFTLTPGRTSLVVTTATDEDNGSSDPTQGTGTSLREAINYAEGLYATQGITSTIQFSPNLWGKTLNLSLGAINLTGGLNINGPGFEELTISGGNNSQIFTVAQNANVSITGVALTQGHGVNGGAIDNKGRLNLSSALLTNNSATYGGAIDNESILFMNSCELDNNTATTSGGGLYNRQRGRRGGYAEFEPDR